MKILGMEVDLGLGVDDFTVRNAVLLLLIRTATAMVALIFVPPSFAVTVAMLTCSNCI